ncbi:TPA: HNH endonuclease, partial [Staphylococcus aureus]|nr:HNH endonuclease [Staphylococcus aureus]
HHLQAWSHGGATDLRNLTLLCRRHHVDNNDNRDGGNGMGHAERDPETGRVGYRSAHTGGLSPSVELNDSPAAEQAPARKLTDPPAQPHAPVDSPPGSPVESPQPSALGSPPSPPPPGAA